MSSDIVANAPRMVPGYSNLGDYLPDDVHYEFLEVEEHKCECGKPLVKDERSLSTMMRVGERSRNSKFSTHHQDQSMEFTSNEREGVHLHTLVDR